MLLSDLRTPATIANTVSEDSLPVGASSKRRTPHTAAVALVARSATLVMRSLVALAGVGLIVATMPLTPNLSSSSNRFALYTCVLAEKSAMTTAATEMS